MPAKKLKPSFLIGASLVLILVISIVLLHIDDTLDEGALHWLELANDTTNVDNNGYYYLVGISAQAGEDPETIGNNIIDRYKQEEKQYLAKNNYSSDFDFQAYPSDLKLPLPDGAYYCRIIESGCLIGIQLDPASIKTQLEQNRILLSRTKNLFAYSRAKSLIAPRVYEILPSYTYLIRGNKLIQFEILLMHNDDRHREALDMLYTLIEAQRRHLAYADNLLYKFTVASLIADNLDLLSAIVSSPTEYSSILPLNTEERSLEPAMIREFGFNAAIADILDQNPALYDENIKIPRWAIKPLYKRNMSINETYRRFSTLAELSKAPAPTILHLDQSIPVGLEPEFTIRNSIGWILSSVAAPAFSKYLARMHDLDCKIRLINVVAGMSENDWHRIVNTTDTSSLSIRNPYDEKQSPVVDTEHHAICFSGPYDDFNLVRCVRHSAAYVPNPPDGHST